MIEKAKRKLPNGQTMTWKDQEYPSIYANVMAFAVSPFDLSLVFGELGESTQTEVTGIPKVKVILSPEQASNLMKLLMVALNTYVEGNGPLRTAGAINLEELSKQIEEQKIVVQQ